MPAFVAYYRVSTDKQGRSGLGLEAQTASIESYAARSGGDILASFKEVETGKNNARPELGKALAFCRQKKAILVIAKLDRLSRNLAFIANLMDSRVEFVACDMPQANRLTLHIMAAMAEHERTMISTRTKDALAATKARGTVLGRRDADTQAMANRRKEQASQFRAQIYPTIKQMRDSGQTLAQIADNLNRMQVRTLNNRSWYASTVRQLLDAQI
ncbi:MAG: recombinase family protein [Cytophagaceae bacterium]|nr:MAG: recombinase family protein [Cytophagaceae bacterium]